MDSGIEKAFWRSNSPAVTEYEDLWPSESRGNGNVVRNNSRDGSAQGKGSFIRKASCRMCGFMNDLAAIDHEGGSMDGNGACFVSSTATATVTLASGATHAENYGEPGVRRGAGCALCGSKNSSKQRILLTGGNPWDKVQNLGF